MNKPTAAVQNTKNLLDLYLNKGGNLTSDAIVLVFDIEDDIKEI